MLLLGQMPWPSVPEPLHLPFLSPCLRTACQLMALFWRVLHFQYRALKRNSLLCCRSFRTTGSLFQSLESESQDNSREFNSLFLCRKNGSCDHPHLLFLLFWLSCSSPRTIKAAIALMSLWGTTFGWKLGKEVCAAALLPSWLHHACGWQKSSTSRPGAFHHPDLGQHFAFYLEASELWRQICLYYRFYKASRRMLATVA